MEPMLVAVVLAWGSLIAMVVGMCRAARAGDARAAADVARADLPQLR